MCLKRKVKLSLPSDRIGWKVYEKTKDGKYIGVYRCTTYDDTMYELGKDYTANSTQIKKLEYFDGKINTVCYQSGFHICMRIDQVVQKLNIIRDILQQSNVVVVEVKYSYVITTGIDQGNDGDTVVAKKIKLIKELEY